MAHLGCQTLPVFLMVLLLSYLTEVIGINLITSPSIITIGGQNSDNAQLTISCSPTSAVSVLAIQIGNYNQNNIKNTIVRIVVTSTIVEVVDKSLEQRMTQTGSINGASGNLELVLSELRCSDAGMYYCSVIDNAATITTDETTRNVTARTYPGEITMNVNPRYTQYDVGNLVEFNCNGRIGNQFPTNMASFWVWQWRYIGSSSSSWTTYPIYNNITYEDPTAAANCQYIGRSRLFHTVTPSDNGRQFRCYVLSNADYGDNYTIYTETPPVTGNPGGGGGGDAPPVTGNPGGGGGGDDEPSKGIDSYSLGVGVAIGMGVMLLCGGICILIAFIYRRKVASGCLPNKKPDTVIFDHRSASTTAEIDSGQTAGGEYEIPGNFYDGLHGRAPDVPTTYEKLKTYQNT